MVHTTPLNYLFAFLGILSVFTPTMVRGIALMMVRLNEEAFLLEFVVDM